MTDKTITETVETMTESEELAYLEAIIKKRIARLDEREHHSS